MRISQAEVVEFCDVLVRNLEAVCGGQPLRTLVLAFRVAQGFVARSAFDGRFRARVLIELRRRMRAVTVAHLWDEAVPYALTAAALGAGGERG
jgi:hypothetical protein